MPELPDVEGFRRVLARHGAGLQISRVRVLDAGVLRDVGARRLHRELEGRTLATPRRHGSLKSALMDQTMIAGLGNLLVDEILWRARLNPSWRAAQLDRESVRTLYRATRTVLRQSMKYGRVPGKRGWLTGRRDEPDPSCPRCGAGLRRSRVGGRSTVWCPRCQGG
jgi:formamidopyrimidine-DNA glycosylase